MIRSKPTKGMDRDANIMLQVQSIAQLTGSATP